jgi:hypothetical protein
MTKPSKAVLIWDRALDCAVGPPLLRGDLELETMLRVHGYVMNGGVFHAVEKRGPKDMMDAESAYRYFGFGAAADLLREAKAMVDADRDLGLLEAEMDKKYNALIPDDSALFEKFEAFLRLNASEFAPL